MIHKNPIGNTVNWREAIQTRTLIADLDRIVQITNADIISQEQQSRVFDRSLAEYPILARTLAARRDNLLVTIAALEQRLLEFA